MQPSSPAGPLHALPAPTPTTSTTGPRSICVGTVKGGSWEIARGGGAGAVYLLARVESGPRFGASDADGMSVRMTMDLRGSGRGLEICMIVRIASRYASP